MLSDILILILIAYILLLAVGYLAEIPLIYILAGIVALFLAVQAYNETSSATVGMSLASVGVVTLLGGFYEAVAT